MQETYSQEEQNLRDQVEQVISEHINPTLQEHNGFIELVDVFPEDRACSVRFRGACSGCYAINDTLKDVVIPEIRKHVRAIRHVEIDNDIDEDVWAMAKNLFTNKS
ncbi:MAG: NifU family protein [Eubacterium sp.]|nr:NifU family protein [Eubacterium sp.]